MMSQSNDECIGDEVMNVWMTIYLRSESCIQVDLRMPRALSPGVLPDMDVQCLHRA